MYIHVIIIVTDEGSQRLPKRLKSVTVLVSVYEPQSIIVKCVHYCKMCLL